MNFHDLLSGKLNGVTADSRGVVPGGVFVAIPGVSRDGNEFIPEALTRGAAWIITENPAEATRAIAEFQKTLASPREIAAVAVPNARAALAELAAGFHNHPSRSMCVVGVTGTSGKTTTTYLLESVLTAAGHRTGVIGTVNFRFNGKTLPSTHTTPDSVELQRLLAVMKAEGCTAVVMEVSSHALRQDRVHAMAFDAVAFTNLSPEHQDFHPDMEHYFRSKAILFNEAVEHSRLAGKRPGCAVNAEDEYGQRLIQELRSKGTPLREFRIGSELRCDLTGIQGSLDGVSIDSALTGRFNASNIAAAVAVGRILGLAPETIARGIHSLALVPGRLQKIPHSRPVHVFVDYAHKPDALEKVLLALRESLSPPSRLITVFGCGGDRDRKKRPVMGRIAQLYSDAVWITSDNPRTEDPDAIIQEILAGIRKNTSEGGAARAAAVHVQPDRKMAIEAAIAEARVGDVVVIAGKGHEDYQIVANPPGCWANPLAPKGTKKIHFDDCEIASEALRAKPKD